MIVESVIGRFSESVDFPENDSKRENVGLGGKDATLDALRSHPTNGNQPMFAHLPLQQKVDYHLLKEILFFFNTLFVSQKA